MFLARCLLPTLAKSPYMVKKASKSNAITGNRAFGFTLPFYCPSK